MSKKSSLLKGRDPLKTKGNVIDDIAPQKDKRRVQKGVNRLTYGISRDTARSLSLIFAALEQSLYEMDYQGPKVRKEVLVEVAIDMLCEQANNLNQLSDEVINRVISAQEARDGWE